MRFRLSLKGQNKGASLIAVVIALIFVSIIGATVMAITQTNIQLRNAETLSKHNFYGAEEVMNEISAGLNEKAAREMQEAYISVLADYRDIVMGSGSLQKAFSDAYMEELENTFWDGLPTQIIKTNDSDPSVKEFVYGNYNKDVVFDGWWHACDHDAGLLTSLNNFKNSEEGRCYITTDDESTYTLDYIEGVFTLQNVKVRYVDDAGYETEITTDIALHTPDLNPDDGSQIRNFMRYALIADDYISVTGATVNVSGSVYAGYNGIVTRGATTSFIGKDIVTRGDILLENGSNMTLGDASSRIWAENIATRDVTGVGGGSPSSSTLTVNGNCYVADDLTLGGSGSNVNLNGNYYGYNFKKDYTGAASPDKAEFSSSIVLNGADGRLDMTGLNYLYVAGRTYISRGGAASTNADIPMGESLSVRTNQLAYNVSAAYVELPAGGDPIATGFKGGDSGLREYVNFVGLTEDQVWPHLDPANPIATYRYLDQGAAGSHVAYRYYLNFKSEQDANDFFYAYWTANSTKLGAYGDGYADAILVSPGLIYTLSGNLLERATDTGVASGFQENKTNIVIADWQAADPSTGADEGVYHTFSDRIAINYMALQMYLEDFHTGIDSAHVRFSEDALGNIDKSVTPLTRNLIDMDALEDREAGTVGVDHLVLIDNAGGAAYATAVNDKGLIIATGDVNVTGSFTGTIIAGGKIILTASGTTVTADENLISEMFKNDAALGSSSIFTKYFVDNGTVADGVIGAVDIGNYVSFENWSRTQK